VHAGIARGNYSNNICSRVAVIVTGVVAIRYNINRTT